MMPTTHAEWIEIANEFGKLYNFPRCIGSLDGKHVEIIKPRISGPSYYNYKSFYSIVLMALVNARKEFIMIDVGTNGKISDGGVLFYTKFWELYEQRKLNLPEPCPLPNTTTNFPYVLVADDIALEEEDKDTITSLSTSFNRNAKSDAKTVRDEFRQYFFDEKRRTAL
ncbi:uncharacterized protein LOC143921537 [Arctopsyche grandis]|uniref:uncharacterized protein LOC143921537 n=1 Tax=Arctopsyche grandis TaxID=121162 RepID=UPI00406D7604